MNKLILSREEVSLNPTQLKMAESGWGNDAIENTVVEKITYNSDGLKVKGFIAYPKNSSEKHPCIIWCRGGIGNSGAIDSFNARGIFGQLASWGYVVFASQYRGNVGGEGKDEFGGSDVNDVLNLIPLANEIPQADKNLWGIEGWSRGGMMTYLALTKTSKFKAAVVTGGIADLRCNSAESRFMRKLYETSIGTFGTDNFNSKCHSRSIVNFPEKLSKETPLLLIHGNADTRVLPRDSLDLSVKLLQQNIPFRLLMLENGDHFLKNHRKEVDTNRKMWFEKYLKNNN
ncbi:MAG: S9 family peptidase [Ignavibacteriae bacterium]|jgi:dipeptidyl aminopeptidase/acylaminoacyl peptidase|nr:S9 family peptidase [Ignavibacteriota bacterium]NOG99030.1 S9 family peptidase [Ignavibacteriota bacterium]